MALTERQQQIVDLQKEGKKPDEIAKALGVSTNAIYQQIRRMRKDKGAKGRRRAPSAPKPGRQSTAKEATVSIAPGSPSTSNSSTAAPPRPATPLQAIRARRDEIKGALREFEAAMKDAERAFKATTEAYDKALSKHTDELGALDAAESAIKGELKLPIRKAAPKRQNGPSRTNTAKSGTATQAPAPAPQAAQEPAQTAGSSDDDGFHDVAAEREAQDAAAETPQEQSVPA